MKDKLLLTADWHIANYSDYNFSHGSRLDQFIKLSDRIIELGKANDVSSLVIAGDLVDKPTMSPIVLHVVKSVIDNLKSYFTNIYYILGQHDLDTKSESQNPDDTAISLFDSSNMIYMHQKTLKIGNSLIGFQNWTPDQDTSWIDNHLDFLIGHYTKSKLFGQDIDESKFDFMIHGDIHNDQEIGKFISIGNPIQNDMKSMPNGSVILLDTINKSFKRLRVDEDHSRFLRIDYTNDENLEGFLNPLQYYIYKPKNNPTSDIEVDDVDKSEINEIVDRYVTEYDLSDIHDECKAKCISYNNIDFDFQITNIHIHGYRSIVDFNLDLTKNDRVLFLGNNGSGKSSIMSALNDLFTYNRHLKDQKSDFTDDMLLQVTLLYQNKTYVISKGSKWGLTINGNEIGYNNKTEFEDDLVNRLPFMRYSDLFFIHSGISNLSDQLNIDRKIELIIKFFRLDELGALSDTANDLSNALTNEIEKDKLSIRDKESQKLYINNSINQTPESIKTLNIDDLNNRLNNLIELKDKKALHNDWINKIDNIEKQMSIHKTNMDDKQKYMSINIDDLRDKLTEVNDKLKVNSDNLIDVNTKWRKWLVLHKELVDLTNKGKELKFKQSELLNKTCPTCHRPISDEPKYKSLIDNIEGELHELRETFKDKRKEYISLLGFKPEGNLVDERYYIDQSEKLLEEKNKLVTYQSSLNTKVKLYESAKTDYDKYKKSYDELNIELNKVTKLNIPDVDLPSDIDDQINNIHRSINQFNQYSQLLTDIESIDKDIKIISDSIEPKRQKISKLNKYSQLTGRTGKIIEVILTQLAEHFSNEKIKYVVSSGITRNNHWIKFESYYRVKNKYRSYDSLSDGQKNISDLYFIAKLFSSSRVGLLELDEFLKHLDESNSLMISEMLGSINVNTLLISTHSSNYPIFTKKVFLELGQDGKTKSKIV